MADQRLTDRATTAVITGGFLYIMIPDAGSATGYSSYRISVTNLHADLQAAIDTNASDITSLSSSISTLFYNVPNSDKVNVTGDYEYTHRAGTLVTAIRAFPTTNGTIKCGTTSGGSEVFGTSILTAGNIWSYESIKDELWNSGITDTTLYFTITGSMKLVNNYETIE